MGSSEYLDQVDALASLRDLRCDYRFAFCRFSCRISLDMSSQKKLMIVCDLGRFRAFVVEYPKNQSPRYQVLEEVTFDEAHQKVIERVSDLAGRHSGPSLHRGAAPVADDHNLENETERRICLEIARRLERHLREHPDLKCWFAAPERIYREILNELPRQEVSRLEKIEPRDISRFHPHELIEVFDPEAFKRFNPRHAG